MRVAPVRFTPGSAATGCPAVQSAEGVERVRSAFASTPVLRL
jgi:hypothetical protein